MKNSIYSKLVILGVSICLIMPSSVFRAFADSSGPGAPGVSPCGGTPNAKGPCTDPHIFTSSGVGNGACGRCGDVSYSYTGGACAGTHPIEGNNCTNCTRDPKVVTRQYLSTPVGSLMYAGCLATVTLCVGGASTVTALGCGAVCYTAGVWTGGSACYFCLGGAGGASSAACCCGFDECKENCDYIHTTTSGFTSGC